MAVSWNLSPRRRSYRHADVLVLSVAKSGRTWLRVLVNKFLSLHFDLPFEIGDLHARNPAVPSILYDHEMWSHCSKAGWLDRALGSNIVPARLLREKKVVLLYRDPRDVVVSLFFHKTKRSRRRMDVDRSEFIRDRHFGVHTIVHVMNLWRVRLAAHPDCFWLRYEEMKTQLDQELLRLLSFLGIDNPNPQHIAEAVAWADFENMKKMEATDAFGSHKLRPRDVSDPDSYKVREGRVGGYRKHFGPDDLRYLDEAVAMLDPFYGYRCASAER